MSPVTAPPGGRPGRDEGLADHSGRALRPGSPRWKVKRYDVGSPRPFSLPIPPPIKGEDFQRHRERPPLCRYPAQQTVPLGAGLSRAACRALLEQVFCRGAWLLRATGPEERCFPQSWRTTEVSGSARLLEDVTHPVVTRAVLTRVGSYQVVELVPGLGSREGVRTHSSPVSWVVRARRCCSRQAA